MSVGIASAGVLAESTNQKIAALYFEVHAKLLDSCKLAIDLASVWYRSGCRGPKEYNRHLPRLVGQSVRSPITRRDGRTSTKECPSRSSSDVLVGNFIASHEARVIRAGAGAPRP